MIIERAQLDRWRSAFTIAIETEPDDFHRDRSKKTGKLGKPQMPKKNATYARNKGGGARLSDAHSHFRDRMRALIKARRLPVCLLPMRILVYQTYGVRKTIGGRDLPGMDASATLEAVCDSLQSAAGYSGLVSDDAQIVDRRAVGLYAPGVYHLRIELEALPHWGMG